MPGEGEISCRQNRRLFLRGPSVWNPRKPGQCFTAMYPPPGLDGRKIPLPRTTKEAFAPLRCIFSELPIGKRGSSRGREGPAKDDRLAIFKGLLFRRPWDEPHTF
jgi:hypothetical protein